MEFKQQVEKLCETAGLGKVVEFPKPLSGGLLHKMYAVKTTSGAFAVKALNPTIMARPEAVQNYLTAEQIARIAAKHVPALPAKVIDGSPLIRIDGSYFLVFDWVEGEILQSSKIEREHAKKMGAILGELHTMDFSLREVEPEHPAALIEWKRFYDKGKEENAEWVDAFSETLDSLYQWTEHATEAASKLSQGFVYSHRDLDPKNVLWRNGAPTVIDWEAAGPVHPMQELLETAIYWSEKEEKAVDKDQFLTFIKAYEEKCGTAHADWFNGLVMGFATKLDWLEYNLKRSLWMECSDEEDQQLGTEQVFATLNDLNSYAEAIPELHGWLKELEGDESG
ncbi:phosphotransferase [Thalassobacillus hwangdonensis]|uniref:Phosphotransferase n=1 Tax=Thalassobacillus hwangdonensis TaxID=546108 RepID=A0ABW3L3K2_9BACI